MLFDKVTNEMLLMYFRLINLNQSIIGMDLRVPRVSEVHINKLLKRKICYLR